MTNPLPTDMLAIPHLAERAAQLWPTSEAVVDGLRRLTFGELASEAKRAAAAFVQAGLQRGERVALWAPNSVEWIVACLGLQGAGGILVPLNTRFRGGEAQYILNAASVAMLVVVDRFLDQNYPDLLQGLSIPTVRRMIRIGAAGAGGYDAFLDAADEAAHAEAAIRLANLGPNDIGDIMFTSGTTGDPKGAVTTYAQSVRTSILWAKATTLGHDDRFLILWPFFHCSGYKAGWVACLAQGATALPEATLDVDRLLAKVHSEHVTFLPGPPTLFQTLLAKHGMDVKQLSSVRVSVTGASSVAPTLITAMRETLRFKTVLTGYGLTETCGTVTMTSPSDPAELVTVSCGRALEGVEIKIVDGDGRELPNGQPGEVLVRGMNVMKEYLDDPVATAKTIDSDAWLHTGDVGILDSEGYLRITDRKKDVYIVGGFNCYPAEVEKILLGHPAVLAVAVTGVPDTRLGEVGKAFVILRQQMDISSDLLIAWSREHMANFKVPRYIEFVDSLPTNAIGKVQKFKLQR